MSTAVLSEGDAHCRAGESTPVDNPATCEACRIPPDAVRLARASTIVTLGHGEDQVVPQDSGREGRRTRGGAAGRAVCHGKARQTDFLGGDRPS
jgi:hypothetical protein